MSVKKDRPGIRSVQVETEVTGTPEEIWKAIATAAGISSWFVPARFETDANGTPTKLVLNFGPGMDSEKNVTAWDPPRRFAAEGELAPGAPKMATEWIVEARGGGTCIVRVVHNLFASTDDWDDQLEGMESGWPEFFNVLRLWLTHFHGQRGVSFYVMGTSSDAEPAMWRSLAAAMGFANAAPGSRVETATDAPRLAGIVESTGAREGIHRLVLRVNEPAAGIVSMGAHKMGGSACAVFNFYFYGESAAEAAAHQKQVWTQWINRQLPAAITAP